MIDLDYLHFLENILTENRKERFLEVLKNRTNHFTVAIEDVFQLHNTSAVMRSCEVFGIQQLNVVEEKYGKNIDKEIAMGAQKWVDVNRFESIENCIETLKNKGYQIIATTLTKRIVCLRILILPNPVLCFLEQKKKVFRKRF